MPATKVNGSTPLIAGVVIAFIATVAACTAIAISITDGARASSLIGLMLAALASTTSGLLALVKIGSVADDVQAVKRHSTDLTNGLMDSKIRAAIAEVVAPGMIDPAARETIALDKLNRDLKAAEHDPEHD